MAVEMTTERWTGVHNTPTIVVKPTLEAVAAAVRALDGRLRTMVSIVFKPPSVMFIGGGGSNGLYVVTASDDGAHFKVATRDTSSTAMVMVTAGGQEGDYPARRCVNLVTAVRAARAFASTGTMDPAIKWEDDY